MGWIEDLEALRKNIADSLNRGSQDLTHGLGLSATLPEDMYSQLERELGTPSQSEIEGMVSRLNNLSEADRAALAPVFNKAFSGKEDSRRWFNIVGSTLSDYEKQLQTKTRNEGIAAGLQDFSKNLSTDSFFKNLRDTIGAGVSGDVLSKDMIEKLVNKSTDTIMGTQNDVLSAVDTEAASRGIYGSGEALANNILAKANLRKSAADSETNIRSGAAVSNNDARTKWAQIASAFEGNLEGIQATLNNAAAALLAGSPDPFMNVQDAFDKLQNIREQEGQIKFLNESSSASAFKDLISLVTSGINDAGSLALGGLSLFKGQKGGSSGSSGSAGLTGFLSGVGSGAGSVGSAAVLKGLGF